MNADSPWGEVRWQERRSSPPSNGSTMATSTLLPTIRPLPTDDRDDNRAFGTQHNFQIDQQFHPPQAQLQYPAPQRMLNRFRTHSDAHNSLDSVPNISRRPHASGTASPQPKPEISRHGSISERIDWQNNGSRRASELPLGLETLGSTDLPSIRTPDRVSPSNQSTLLPSFSSLQRSANCGDDSAPESASKPGSPTCRGCVDRKSAIDDIALAVIGLDETIQTHGLRYRDHRPERPQDCPLRTAQWVLDCLKETRAALQDSFQPATSGYRTENRPDPPTSFLNRSASPLEMGKRQLDYLDTDEEHLNKRLRTNSHIENHLEIAPMLRHLDDNRRASESLQRTHPSRNYSPTLSDSWAGSVHPHQHSPGLRGRSPRPPPSPSSMAATSHRASLSSYTVPPGRSSTTANQPATSIHTAPALTAASQHIADLQHQVTLKSLSLQTLQSEYTSLLQKFQKDRLKSQTTEKKTIAADQEVNELTMRNEELAEQVKSLNMQLEDCERKRETERSDAVREKEQWGRMLEMSGRLQAKSADDRQKLVQEKDDLQQRLLIRENENEATINASKSGNSPDKIAPSTGQKAATTDTENKTTDEQSAAHMISLQRDNHVLQTRTNMLRSTLERVEGQYASIMEKRREMLEQELAQIPGAIAAALQEDGAFPRPTDSRPDRSLTGRDLSRRNSVNPSPSQERRQSRVFSEIAAPEVGAVENIALPNTPSTTTNHAADSISNPQTHQSNTAASKAASNSKLKAVPLPKWQPPGTSGLRTEHLSNNQRRPSGPATPFPGSESSQWQSLDLKSAALPPSGNKSSPPSNPLIPLYAAEKPPARDYSPQYIPPAQVPSSVSSSEKSAQRQQQHPVTAAMPPPPRPGGGGVPPSQSASWRPLS